MCLNSFFTKYSLDPTWVQINMKSVMENNNLIISKELRLELNSMSGHLAVFSGDNLNGSLDEGSLVI